MTMDQNPTHTFQRRKVLIKRNLQLKYMAMVFFSVLMASLIVGFDIYYSIANLVRYDNPVLAQKILQFNTVIVVKVALYLFLMLMISLFVSHRFAGPIFRFEKSARIAGSGDLVHRVSLRTGDELLELQDEFNAMLANLQSLVRKDRDKASDLAARVDKALKTLPQDAAVARAELHSLKNDLKGLTQSFKI